MQTVYVLFICTMVNGQVMPPCDQGREYSTAAECKRLVQGLEKDAADQPPNPGLRYADGREFRLKDRAKLCMSETTAPATVPVWKPVL
jgi:hypothetical protein